MNAPRTAILALSLAAVTCAAAADAQSPGTWSPRRTPPGPDSTSNSYPFGRSRMEYQQIHSAGSFRTAGPRTLHGMFLTPAITSQPTTVDLELWMARSPHGSSRAQGDFAANEVANTLVRVLDRRTVTLPANGATWGLHLPFDRPFAWDGGHLAWRIKVFANGAGDNVRYSMDADDSANSSTRNGSFAGCAGSQGSPTYHDGRLRAPGSPVQCRLDAISGVTSRSLPGVINVGLSASSFQGVSLPFDLGPIGMPGCRLMNDVLVTIPGTADAGRGGRMTVWFDLPRQPGLPGSTLYTQAAFLQPGVNQLGVFMSPGATHVVPSDNRVARIYGDVGDRYPRAETHYGLVVGFDAR